MLLHSKLALTILLEKNLVVVGNVIVCRKFAEAANLVRMASCLFVTRSCEVLRLLVELTCGFELFRNLTSDGKLGLNSQILKRFLRVTLGCKATSPINLPSFNDLSGSANFSW